MMTGQVNSVWIGAHDRDGDDVIRYLETADVISDTNPLWVTGQPQHNYTAGPNTYQHDAVYMNKIGQYRLFRADNPDYFACEAQP